LGVVSTRKNSRKPSGYVAYYRVSSQRQGESGLGLDAQRLAVSHLAKDAPILAEYTEVESAKRHENRPQLLAALADAKKRNATLLIAKLDRLARNVHFISGLMESGVEFRAADLPEANRLMLHLMAAMAEHERELISNRTKAGMDAAKREIEKNGFRISRRSGQAYSKHGNPRWEESIEKATDARRRPPAAGELVEMIMQRKNAGESLRAIAQHLNATGVKTPSGAQWYASTVRAALLREPD
jgi:DNA invertase Pin-like site-specific DNA recombinase